MPREHRDITKCAVLLSLVLCACPDSAPPLTRWDYLERDRQACAGIGGRFSFKSNAWTNGFDTQCDAKDSTP